jgi:hypothetical protein
MAVSVSELVGAVIVTVLEKVAWLKFAVAVEVSLTTHSPSLRIVILPVVLFTEHADEFVPKLRVPSPLFVEVAGSTVPFSAKLEVFEFG